MKLYVGVEHGEIAANCHHILLIELFQDLRYLQALLLNRNSISAIELDAFSSLTKLTTINLTYNRLELFDNRIFEQNLHLTSVDLSGNKFMHLPNMPILRSTSLKVDIFRINLFRPLFLYDYTYCKLEI